MTAALIVRAQHHIGEPGGENTCVSNGIGRWAKEAGFPFPDTASVSELRKLAQAGDAKGWTYHEGMAGVRVGDVVDWKDFAHVSVVDAMDWQGYLRSIGSGGPTGLVAYQPKGGGFNPTTTFRGYFRAPSKKPAPTKVSTKTGPIKTGPIKTVTYVVKDGDTLSEIAERAGTTWKHLAQLNSIDDPDHIEAGWRLRLK